MKKEIDKSIEVSGKKTSKGESPSSHARRVLMTHFVHQLRSDLGNSVLGDSNISQPRLAKRKPKSLASPSSVSISLTEAQTHIHYAAIPSWLGLRRIRTAHLTTKDNCHCAAQRQRNPHCPGRCDRPYGAFGAGRRRPIIASVRAELDARHANPEYTCQSRFADLVGKDRSTRRGGCGFSGAGRRGRVRQEALHPV